MKYCAVIPAAGKASRLQYSLPKLLLPLSRTETIWSRLRQRLSKAGIDHIHVVVSPQNQSTITQALQADIQDGLVSLSIQTKPIGMGDAIFCGYSVWSQAEAVLIIWGDQACVSEKTMRHALSLHEKTAKTVVLPLCETNKPYVEYIFSQQGQLIQIKQSREGDQCNPRGLADVGTFVLSVEKLHEAWKIYLQKQPRGNTTQEINFLPFIVMLAQLGWQIRPYIVDDPLETQGINTRQEWELIREHFAK